VTNEVCFSWETLYADRADTVTGGVYSSPQDSFDVVQADADLGDVLETDHDRVPLGSFVFGPSYNGTCFALKDNLLYYCKAKQPEYWPTTYYIEVSTPQLPLKTGVFYNGQPYAFSATEVFYIQGTGHGTFFPLPMRARTGAQSVRGAISVQGRGIYHVGPDGLYLFGSGTDSKITEDAFEPIFRGETVNGMPGVSDMSTSILWEFRNRLYFAYQSSGKDYPSNVLVLNLETGRAAYYEWNDGSVVQIRAVAVDTTNKRLLIGDSTGYVRSIENSAYTDDSGEAIAFDVQSKDFELQTRKHFPRWIKYDVDASSASACTGELILDGVSKQSHTITEKRNTRRRQIGTCNGNRSSVKVSGTGVVAIYAAEFE
jgi:hypothetical protein